MKPTIINRNAKSEITIVEKFCTLSLLLVMQAMRASMGRKVQDNNFQ
jgi:hypothetical protein